MLRFLDRLSDRDLLELLPRSMPQEGGRGLDREAIYRVLMAIHGFDLLFDRAVRRALLLTLPIGVLQSLVSLCGQIPAAKEYDLALQLTTRPWRAGSALVRRIADELSIPEGFLPDSSRQPDAVEVVEPFSPPPPLFDYQQEVVDRIVEVLEGSDQSSALLQLPTGAGKTRTAMEALTTYLGHRAREGAFPGVLWLAHTEELCDQAVDAFCRVWRTRGSHEVKMVRFWSGHRPLLEDFEGAFIVSGYQKLVELKKRDPQQFGGLMSLISVVVVDEAHKALAPTIRDLIEAAREISRAKVLGLSATPGRGVDDASGNRDLARIFGGLLLRPNSLGSDAVGTLQARGVLATPNRIAIETGVPIESSDGPYGDGDVALPTLRRLAESSLRNSLVIDAVMSQVIERRPTLVFCCTVEHARRLAVDASLVGAKAAFVDCRMRRGLRRKVVHAFREGDVNVLFNFGVLSTGFDVPGIESVIVARPTTSIVLYSQMVGRGLRGAAVGGTREFNLIDVRDNLESFGDVQKVFQYFDDFWGG